MTDEEINQLVEELQEIGADEAADVLLALKARAEAAEASAHDAWGQRNAIYAELTKAQARAEAAEKHVAFLRDALGEEHQSVWRDAKLSVSTEKAVEIMLEWNASADRAEARAEAAEKALQEIVDNTSERSLASNIARAALEATP